MMDTLLQVRAYLPIALVMVFMLIEQAWPFLKQGNIARHRINNIALGGINGLLTLVLMPASLVTLAANLSAHSAPLTENSAYWLSALSLNQWFDTQHWLWQVVCFIVLDAAIYWQHRLSHRIPMLWRLHRVHHTETAMNTTTAVRFHTLEILASLGFKALLIIILCPHPLTVLCFEMTLNAMALFNHTNTRLPSFIERPLRWLIVTPAMHRVHHSPIRDETNSNYGFNLSIWDHIFRSYRHHSRQSDDAFIFGIEYFRETKQQDVLALLTQPFRSEKADPAFADRLAKLNTHSELPSASASTSKSQNTSP